MRKIILFICLFLVTGGLKAQCTFNGTNNGQSYSITIQVTPIDIVVTNCSSAGFNYNVEMYYEITTTGNAPSNLFTFQGSITCNSNQNSFFQLPNNLTPASGTTTSVGNQYIGGQNCTEANNATPQSLGCNTINIEIGGPGIPNQTVQCPIAILPIELNYFNAQVNEHNEVELSWQTLSETNNDFFTIEYSYNGLSWTELDQIEGAGTVQEVQNYFYLHANPLGNTIYYRLKQTDFDGSYSYSDIVQVNNLETKQKLIVYPNPVQSTAIIEYTGNKEIELISIADVLGNQFRLNAEHSASNRIEVDFTSVPSGVYFVTTNLGSTKIVKTY